MGNVCFAQESQMCSVHAKRSQDSVAMVRQTENKKMVGSLIFLSDWLTTASVICIAVHICLSRTQCDVNVECAVVDAKRTLQSFKCALYKHFILPSPAPPPHAHIG